MWATLKENKEKFCFLYISKDLQRPKYTNSNISNPDSESLRSDYSVLLSHRFKLTEEDKQGRRVLTTDGMKGLFFNKVTGDITFLWEGVFHYKHNVLLLWFLIEM